ncbi:MAG: hypothetical protein QW727_03940 [Candidatus Pacearchaeota archaeon]
MIINEEDLKILSIFAKKVKDNYTTTWEIMKEVYPKDKWRDKEHNKVKNSLNKMINYKIIEYKGQKPFIDYSLSNKVRYHKYKFDKSRVDVIIFKIGNKNIMLEI